MKYRLAFTFIVISITFFSPDDATAREIPPIVPVEWLEKNLADPRLVVVDIRKVEQYRAGHIPGAFNLYCNALTPGRHNLRKELPCDEDLRDVLAYAGIKADSLVVFAGDTDWICGVFSMTRVAMTFIYAGIPNVAVLDGGTTKWDAEGKPLSTEIVKRKTGRYEGEFRKDIFIDKIDLASHLDDYIIVDTREPDFYKGDRKLRLVARAGRIKGAVNLPVCSRLIKQDGVYRSVDDLRPLVEKAAGKDLNKRIVLYCDTGMEATGLWFLMTQVFDYTHVRVYDGSCQEWAEDQKMPMEK